MRRTIALVACFALTASLAHAAPRRQARRHGHAGAKVTRQGDVAPPVAELDPSADERSDDADDEPEEPRRTKRSRAARALGEDDGDRTSRQRAKADQTPSRRSRSKRGLLADERAEGDQVAVQRSEAEHATSALAHDRSERDRAAALDGNAVDDDDRADAPAVVREAARQARPKPWHVAIGPYLWASAVEANVSLGSASLSAGIDFLDITRHARYGVPLLAEARYGRFSFHGDLLYGVVDVSGAREVGPLMVTVAGTASTLLADGIAGVMLAGGEHSILSLEARAGVRYQRTAISAAVDVSGSEISPPNRIDDAADVLAGARAVLQPFKRLSLSGTFDLGVLGASTNTWSLSTEASLRLGKHARLALGWRTLTTERANVSLVMHGPRAAVQLTF